MHLEPPWGQKDMGSPVFSACVSLQCVYQLHLGTVPHECHTKNDIKVGKWGVHRLLEPFEREMLS